MDEVLDQTNAPAAWGTPAAADQDGRQNPPSPPGVVLDFPAFPGEAERCTQRIIEAHIAAKDAIAALAAAALESHQTINGGIGRRSPAYKQSQVNRSHALRCLNDVGITWADLGVLLGVRRQVAEKIARRPTLQKDH